MTNKPWTTTEQTRLAELIRQGLSATDISKLLHRSAPSLYAKAKEIGAKFHGYHPHNVKVTQTEKAQIRRLVDRGVSREEILKRFDITRNHLNAIIRGDR